MLHKHETGAGARGGSEVTTKRNPHRTSQARAFLRLVHPGKGVLSTVPRKTSCWKCCTTTVFPGKAYGLCPSGWIRAREQFLETANSRNFECALGADGGVLELRLPAVRQPRQLLALRKVGLADGRILQTSSIRATLRWSELIHSPRHAWRDFIRHRSKPTGHQKQTSCIHLGHRAAAQEQT